MRSVRQYAPIFSAVLLLSAAADAARVDMKDPRRVSGREDDIRVDAQLTSDEVANAAPISVTYQIENLSPGWIAVADKVCSSDFDRDAQMITLSVGAEVPVDGVLPHLVTIAPGAKKTLSAVAIAHVAASSSRSPLTAVPRQVQVKVNILRDLAAFKDLIARQESAGATTTKIRLTDLQFDAWMQASAEILLNSVPVHWTAGNDSGIDAEQPGTRPGRKASDKP